MSDIDADDLDVEALAERLRPLVERLVAQHLEPAAGNRGWPLVWDVASGETLGPGSVHEQIDRCIAHITDLLAGGDVELSDEQRRRLAALVGLTNDRVSSQSSLVTAPTPDDRQTTRPDPQGHRRRDHDGSASRRLGG